MEVTGALAELLETPGYRERAMWMSSVIQGYDGGAPAVRLLERLTAEPELR